MATENINLSEYKILKNEDYIYRDLVGRYKGDQLIGHNSAFDIDAIKNALKNLFLVGKGEMPGKPQFGNPLQLSVFDNFDYFSEKSMQKAIEVEIQKYEPRVEVLEVKINDFPELNRIVLEIVFKTNLKENNIQDSIYLPFSRNDYTYLSGRIARSI